MKFIIKNIKKIKLIDPVDTIFGTYRIDIHYPGETTIIKYHDDKAQRDADYNELEMLLNNLK